MNDLSRLVSCTGDVSRWFLESGLLLNPTKIEAIVFGTAARLKAVDMSIGIMAAGSNIKFFDAVKLLGVNLDRCLTMDIAMWPVWSSPAISIFVHCVISDHV